MMRTWTLLWTLLAGCGEGEPAGPSDTVAAATDTGTLPAACVTTPFGMIGGQGNEATFEPGVDGDVLTLYFGPQGGWHVDAAVYVSGLGPSSTVSFDWTLTVLDEGWVVGDPDQPFFTNLNPYDAATCQGNVAGALAYLDQIDVVPGESNFARGCALDGHPLRMDLAVLLDDGRTASTTIEGTAAVDLSVLGDCFSTTSR